MKVKSCFCFCALCHATAVPWAHTAGLQLSITRAELFVFNVQ